MSYEFNGLSRIENDLSITNDRLYLDFGHGGSDDGCTFYDGTKEKKYNLKFGLAVYNLLKPHFKKIYVTRNIDRTVSLETRTKYMKDVAKKNKSVHVYSIHCNAYNQVASGAEVAISVSTKKTDKDYKWTKQFLNDYCKEFNFNNRGILQRKGSNGDYYYLHRNTPSNCKVKIVELFFGDNRNDCKKAQTDEYFDKATFFLASYILKRYGKFIEAKKVEDIYYYVQVGAFNEKKNAQSLVSELKKKGFNSIIKTK